MEESIVIDKLIDILSKNELSEVNFQDKDFKIKIKKDIVIEEVPQIEEPIIDTPVEDNSDIVFIKSTNIGKFFFYDKNGVPLIAVGQTIKVGQTIGYISTVGIKTSIKSEVAGSIEQILLKNGEVTDYGKKLIKVKKIVD